MKLESIRDYSYSLLFIVFGLIHLVKILFLFAKLKYSFSLLNIWFSLGSWLKIGVYLKSILLTLYKRTYIIEIEQVHAIVHVCVYG